MIIFVDIAVTILCHPPCVTTLELVLQLVCDAEKNSPWEEKSNDTW